MITEKIVDLGGSKKHYKVTIESYLSAQEVVEDCKTRPVHDYDDMTTEKLREKFHGVRTYEQALELLKNGYQPTVNALSSALKMSRTGNGKRISFENNVHGFAPIVPLALKGIPNSMINTTMKPIKCKVVDVYYDMGISWSHTPNEIIEAGQVLLGVIIELEKQGYRFNLYAMQGFCNEDGADILCVKVKSSDKPLDLKRISFPLTHPAFFRVIGFDWQSKSPAAHYRGGGRGYALTTEISNKQAKSFAQQAFGDNAVYLSCNSINKDSEDYLREVLTNAK